MSNKILIENLILISKSIGSNNMYVQGGGGNTSVKIDDNTMAIKSSGIALKDMDIKNGYSLVNYNLIKELISSNSLEEEFNEKTKNFILNNKKPSMEFGFHSLLKNYVIHTHSVYVNVLTCSKEGKDLTKKLFKDSIWIDYVTPGFDLTLAIQSTMLKRGFSQIIFLQNHGLIVSSDNYKEALELHSFVNETVKNYLNISETSFTVSKNHSYNIVENILFPDQVIYASNNSLQETTAYKETLLAYNFILTNILKNNLTPNFIEKDKANLLLEMESEKYRQSLLKK